MPRAAPPPPACSSSMTIAYPSHDAFGADSGRVSLSAWRRTAPKRSTCCARSQFDLMLLDVWMPRIDGLAVLDRMKRFKHRPKVVS